MAGTRQTIQAKIIALLKVDATLAAAVKTWSYGIPIPGKIIEFPHIFVQWGPSTGENNVRQLTKLEEEHRIDFWIVAIVKNNVPEQADKDIEDLIENVEAALIDNPTLDGSVLDSYASAIQPIEPTFKEGQAFSDELAFASARLTWTCFVRVAWP